MYAHTEGPFEETGLFYLFAVDLCSKSNQIIRRTSEPYKTDFLSPDKNYVLFIRTSAGEWCLPSGIFCPPDGFKMITMSKGWIDGSDRLAIKNNKHEPNRYSKFYLIKDNICKLSICNSPWVTSYCRLSLTTISTY